MSNIIQSHDSNGVPVSQSKLAQQFLVQKREVENVQEVTAETRIDRITRCIDLLAENSGAIADAIVNDYGCRSRYQTMFSEVVSTLQALKYARKHVKKWMRPEKRKSNFPYSLIGARSEILYQPLGVIGVIAPWNFPVHLAIAPLAGILAAGNRCMIKPSEHTPCSADLLTKLIGSAFDESEIAVVTGGPEIAAEFSCLPFDHLLFTGGTDIGRLVMQSAADHLVPVTLELGGKNPVIVGRTANMSQVAACCAGSKTLNAGQVCLAPDYIFIEETQLDSFITEVESAVAKQFPTMLNNDDYGSVLGERNYQRLQKGIEDARQKGARIIELKPDGEDFSNQIHHKIPLTLIVGATSEMGIMQEEIFGPLLPVMTYQDPQEAIDYINRHPRSLTLYYFGHDRQEKNLVLRRTISGGVTVNDMIVHYAQDDLPFGGIGNSGIGSYSGIHGFRRFSHAKAIFHQQRFDIMRLLGIRLYGPYSRKNKNILKMLIRK